MTHLKRAIAIVLCSMVLPGAVATAQDACPATATCYEGHELEFDAADGPVQFLVVRKTDTIVTTLDEQKTVSTVVLVEFVSKGNGVYEQRGDELPPYAASGVLKTAETYDTFGLAEIGGE